MQIQLKTQQHRFIFIFGLILLTIGLGWGAFPLSFSIIILLINWLWEGNFSWKYQQIKSSNIAIVLILFYLLHIVGVLWSDNYTYALKDLKIKIPLFLLPLLFVSTNPLKEKEWKLILNFFVLSIITTTLWSMLFYLDILHPLSNGSRELSRFDSHIRLSLKIILAICICTWWLTQKLSFTKKLVCLTSIIWFLSFLFILSSLNGVIILSTLTLTYLFIVLFKMNNSYVKYVIVFSLVSSMVYLFLIIKKEYNNFFIQIEPIHEKLDMWTATNDLYFHEKNLACENGYFVWRYNAYPELKREWNKASNFKFDSLDKKGMNLKFTIVRYMTSLGLRKDSAAFRKLSKDDIESIENGFTNFRLVNASHFKTRLYEMFWEVDDYLKNGTINGHSFMMRVEYWKTAIKIIRRNLCIGVGTGDVQDEFTKQYIQNKSQLKTESERRRAHSQFLEITVQFGIVGLLFFLLSLVFPLLQLKNLHPLYLAFILVFLISLIAEDTIETQMGVSLYAFFNAFFLFLVRQEITHPKD